MFKLYVLWVALALPGNNDSRVFEPLPLSEETYTESRTLIGVLKGGSYIHVQMMVTNVGLGSQKGVCKLLWLRPGHEPMSAVEKGSREQWLFDSQSESLTVNRCNMRNTKFGVVLTGRVEECHFEMKFSKRAQRVSLPQVTTATSDSLYEYELNIPWSDVQVQWTGPEGHTAQLEGRGFMDHSRSTAMPRELASRWLRFLGLERGREVIIRLRYPSKMELPTGWLLRGKSPQPVRWQNVVVRGLDTMPSSETFEFSLQVGHDTYTIRIEKTLYRYAPLEEMNGLLAAMVRPFVGRPETSTYQAVLTGPRGVVHPGILEIGNNYK